MKTDDPRLEESRKRLTERVQRINDLILTVLKNHLMLEQFINEFLAAYGKKTKGKGFDAKAKLCERQKPPEIEAPIWRLITAVNYLRNKIAHTIDQNEIQSKVNDVRAAYVAALTPEQQKHAKDLDDVRTTSGAFELCGAYIVGATEARRNQ
jgi:hypothetical protein